MNKKILAFLAVALSGFIVYLFDKIWGNSIDWEIVREVKIGEWISTKFMLYQIIGFLLIAFILHQIGKHFFFKESFYSRKQKKLRLENNDTDGETGILFRWDVFFDYNTPFISNLTAFCTKHQGSPLRFMGNRCQIHDCENYKRTIDIYKVKNIIESGLIDKWEKIK